jgi:anti-anti-sigma factor
MEIELIEDTEGVTHVRLAGRLDATGADQIGIRLTAVVVARGQSALMDLSGVSFVASLGIRLLISCAKGLKVKGATMVVYGARPEVQEVFDDAALDQILPIAGTHAQALERLQG